MRKFGLIFLCVAFTFGLNAQARFGLKAGGTISNLAFKEAGNAMNGFNLRLGFQAGGMLEYSFSESVALQPELLYVLNGSKPDAAGGAELSMAFHNIQLPVNFKYKFGVDNLKFYAAAGPYVGYIAAAKLHATANGISASVDMFSSLAGQNDLELRHLDYGLGAGFGIEIYKIVIGAGYQYGLANLTRANNASIKSGTFNLSAGYFF